MARLLIRISLLAVIIFLVWSAIYLLNHYLSKGEDELVSESAQGMERHFYHTVREGETLEDIFLGNEVRPEEAYALIDALIRVREVKKLQVGEEIEFVFGGNGDLIRCNLFVSPVEIYEVRRAGDGYNISQVDVHIETEVSRIAVRIDSSLYNAFISAGETPALIDKIVDIFAWDVDFYYDPRRGDKVYVIVEKHSVGGEFYNYGRILAAEYDGKIVDQLAVYFESPDGKRGYYDEKGRSLARNFLKTPVKYTRVSSQFGRRLHPITHRFQKHLGTDYAAPTGAPVWAMGDGTVIKRQYGRYAGNYIAIKHGRGYETRYLHLSRFQPSIRVGSRVRQKDMIGYVGTTGRSTGPHLHLEIIRNGQHTDPLRIKKVKEYTLSGEDIANFQHSLPNRIAELHGEQNILISLPDPLIDQ